MSSITPEVTSTAAAFYASWPTTMGKLKAAAPEIGRAFGPYFQGLMKEGALSVKHKELIALALGVAARCDFCVYTHVEKCLKAGATAEEIMDATGVAVMMGGGPSYTFATVVSGALEHLTSQAQPV